MRAMLLSTILEAVLVLSAVPSARATGIYWTDPGSDSIGHANLDGTGVNNKFISGVFYGPIGIAVDQTYLYYTFPTGLGAGSNNRIARANLDSTGVNNNFIGSDVFGFFPNSVAVDGSYIYWGDYNSQAIGRANLDGTGVNKNFITGVSPFDLTVDGAHIYWSTYQGNTIGRANLDGTGVNLSFITGASSPNGVAVDEAHVYWTNDFPNSLIGSIGRANLDGTGVNQSFVPSPSGWLMQPRGVAVDGTYLYWNDPSEGIIGRASLDGTDVIPNFSYYTTYYTWYIAVQPVPEPNTGLLVIAGLVGLAARHRS